MITKIRFALAAASVSLATFPAIAKSQTATHDGAFLDCSHGKQEIAYGNPAVGVIQVAHNANVDIEIWAESPNDNAEYQTSALRISVPFAPDPGPVGMALVGNKYRARVSVSGSLAGYTPSRVEGHVANINTLAHNVIVRINASCVYQARPH